MKKIPVAAILAASLLIFGTYLHAEAHDNGKPMTKKAHKMKCDEMKKMRPLHEIILETHAIMLETIKLVEQSSKNEEAAKDASALSHRLEDLIQKHKTMHENMMKKMCGGKMSDSGKEMEKMD